MRLRSEPYLMLSVYLDGDHREGVRHRRWRRAVGPCAMASSLEGVIIVATTAAVTAKCACGTPTPANPWASR
jgi:hypothetical protein